MSTAQLIKDVPVRTYPKDFWKKFDESVHCIRRGRKNYIEFIMKRDQTFLVLHKTLYWFVMWDIKHYNMYDYDY